jgi:hypothetical protein
VSLRGQPNFKKKIWEFFESMIMQNKNFQDMDENGMQVAWKENEKSQGDFETEYNGELHKGIKENDHGKIAAYLNEISEMGSKVTVKTIMKLECRNEKGQTPLLLAAELD